MTRKLDTLHRILRLDSDHAGALRVAFAAAAGAFGADAPEFFSRLARADLAAVSPCSLGQLAAAANAEVATLDLADAERYPAGAGRPARARIGVHEEVTVLRDGYPVRWAVAGEPLAAGESLGCSTRGVLSFGTGHSGVRLVEQVADSRESSTVGGTGEYLDFGYWQIDRELDPFTGAPRMNEVGEGKDHLASARTRLEAARDALDALEPDDRCRLTPTEPKALTTGIARTR